MIVLGADAHKRSHTVAAINTATGQLLGDNTVAVGARGFAALVIWARGLDGERVWALEDCRHVSGALERFLIARGERVVRVSTRLMAGTRRSSRERGKSDQIDAVSVARAALAAGIETLPTAALAGPELDIRLLVDHRERLVGTRVALNSTLQWNHLRPHLVPRPAAAPRHAAPQQADRRCGVGPTCAAADESPPPKHYVSCAARLRQSEQREASWAGRSCQADPAAGGQLSPGHPARSRWGTVTTRGDASFRAPSSCAGLPGRSSARRHHRPRYLAARSGQRRCRGSCLDCVRTGESCDAGQ